MSDDIKAKIDALQSELDALRVERRVDPHGRAEAGLAAAEKSGSTESYLHAIAQALLAVAFELRWLRHKR